MQGRNECSCEAFLGGPLCLMVIGHAFIAEYAEMGIVIPYSLLM